MNRKRRSATLATVAAAAVPLIAFPFGGMSATAGAAFDYFPTEPTRVLTLSLLPGGNNDDLSGVMCQAPRTCEDIVYSRLSDAEAVVILNSAVRDGTTGKQIIFAYSQGARVAADWVRASEGTEGAPTAEQLSFVLMGNPGRKYGGSDRSWQNIFPDTGYRVIDVSQEYDLASDFPDDRNNFLAMINANMAFFTTHQNYETVDIYSEANYVWTEGNTTYVFVPTKNLPMLEPLRWFGLGFVADALNAPLKEVVDRAYDRSYLPAQPGLPPTTVPEPEPTPEGSGSPQTAQLQLTSARTGSVDVQPASKKTPRDEISQVDEDLDEDDADNGTPSDESDVDLDDDNGDVEADLDADLDAADEDATDASDVGDTTDDDADGAQDSGNATADAPSDNAGSPGNDA